MNVLIANRRKSATFYDVETADWATRVAGVGGAVSQTTLDAVQKFVVAMKASGLWALCQEIGIFAGSTLPGALQKLKYVSQSGLTNNNFVAGDYAETGGNGGLLGDGTTKFLGTGYNCSASIPDAAHLSFYLREAFTGGGSNRVMMGVLDSGSTNDWALYAGTPGSDVQGRIGGTVSVITPIAPTNGFFQINRLDLTTLRLHYNGPISNSNATPVTLAKPNLTFNLWAWNFNGTPFNFMNKRGSYYSIGSGMTSLQSQTHYALVQQLQTDLSRQV